MYEAHLMMMMVTILVDGNGIFLVDMVMPLRERRSKGSRGYWIL